MTNGISTCIVALALMTSVDVGEDARDRFLPPEVLNLELVAPIGTWDEAIPLGNGLMGGLLWGQESTIRLSLG